MANRNMPSDDELAAIAPQPVPQDASQLAKLSPARLELLARLVKQQRGDAPKQPPIARLSRNGIEDSFTLSFAQQRLWFLDQLEPGSPAYNIPSGMRLDGPLDRAALRQSLNAIVQRHEVLRTSIRLSDGEPAQWIVPRARLALPLCDLAALPEADREAATRQLAASVAEQPFDLARGPLVRTLLLRLAPHSHVLLMALHHIIADGWSLGVLMRDMAALYSAVITAQPPQLADLPFQYADFAIWQRAWVEQTVLVPQRAYWRERLAGLRPLDLPTDYPRPLLGSFRGASHQCLLAAPLTAALHALSRRAGVTLFMTLLAAFQTLLYRYSGQHDIAVGTPVAGRTQAATEHLLGCFVNTLVLRGDLSGDPTALMLLERVRSVTLGAFDHQELPFELLVEALAPERDVARHPLFQVLFVLQNAPIPVIELPGAVLRPLSLPNAASKFDLMLTLSEEDGVLEAVLEYRSELFAAPTAQRLLNQFQTLLASLVADPDRRLSALTLLTRAERAQLLVEWNATAIDYAAADTLHQLVADQAARSPDAVAVVFDLRDKETRRQGDKETAGRTTRDGSAFSLQSPRGYPAFSLQPSAFSLQLTYRELNARANQLAHYLQALGVAPETIVALQIERSPELVIALLGVLMAGGAYLPLDRAYPAQRLRYMLDDAQVRVLITTKDEGRRTKDEETQSESLHDLGLTIDVMRASPTAIVNRTSKTVNSDNLAYVLYTSGSTGTPKGVLTSHRAIRNRLLWMQATYQLAPAERVLHKTPLSFDVSIWELFWPLTTGATLVLARPDGHKDAAYLAELLGEQCISTLHFVPSLLAVFLAERELARCTSLRRVLCSGEALPRELPARFFARLDAELHNLYGPTEAAIDVTAWRCNPARDGRAVPIGRPIANTQTYVLDAHLRPQPIGVPGELYLGGVQLARGYLARPDLTAERFVPNPFAMTKDVETQNLASLPHSSRLYKTGDLARYRADGAIEYLGRLDGQIKLRGQRIELGEIEAVLTQHEAVRAAAVLLHAHADSARLVAYVVPTSDEGRTTNEIVSVQTQYIASVRRPSSFVTELRSFLAARLPEYMLPAAFVLLDALPLTSNGKLDRAALPATDLTADSAFVAPRSPSEQTLAAIWQLVLGLERVGIHDNFFALGGDSIRSIRVLALAREHGLQLALPQLFQHQTIAALARAAVPTEELDQESIALPPFGLLAPADRARMPSTVVDAYPLAHLQAGMLFHSEADPTTARYHNFSSIHLRAPCNAYALHRALQQLAARHPVLRSAFDLTHFSEPLQLVEHTVTIPLTVVDLRALDQTAQARALAAWRLAEQQHKFAWQRAPLLRLALLRRSEESFQLGLVEHHAILDGWSVAALLRELLESYLAHLHGQLAPLAPALRRSFGEFVAAERAVLASEAAQQFWAEQLHNRPLTRLPRWPATDRALQPQIRSRAVPISELDTTALLRHARTAALPLKALLLAVHVRVLALLSGQEAVLTGLTMNGRSESSDGERVLGLFLNTVPLRLRLSGGSWLGLARAAFAAEQALLPYRRYPLATLQQQAGGAVLFESAFNFVHFHIYEGIRDLAGVEILEGETLQETNFILLANFSLDPLEQQLHLTLDYEATELGDAQLAQIGSYYSRALAALAHAPEAPYEQELLLSQAERHQLLVERNALPTEVRGWKRGATCIHVLFEQQVTRTPDAIAVVFDETKDERRKTKADGSDSAFSLQPSAFSLQPSAFSLRPSAFSLQLTYAELDRRANQLAHFLHARGVGPDVCVALAFERSLELVVAILGVLKAGGAYVPLDPAYPAERIAFMLADSQATVLLTTQADKQTSRQADKEITQPSVSLSPGLLVSPAPSLLVSRTVVDLAADWPVIAQSPAQRPQVAVDPANLAYVIYTSGSTGTPKGVLTQHSHVARLFAATQEQFRFDNRDVWTLFHSYAFDFSVWELWGALAYGGRLVIVPHWLSRTPDAFLRLLRAERVTVLNQTPSAFRQLSQVALATSLDRDLRWVIFGGEALDVPSLAPWFDQYGDQRPALVNMYGITETTVHVTRRPIRAADLRNPVGSVIGAPLADLAVYVLDQRQQPAPVGVAGELYVGGAGVARGYLGRPELTAERFVPNPFADERQGDKETRRQGDKEPGDAVAPQSAICNLQSAIGTRLYKTGDLARIMPNGDLVYLGRRDQQVKIRGYRIELGEVAAALARHPALRDAVVITSPDAAGEARLVAYVVLIEDEGRRTNEIVSVETQYIASVRRPSSLVQELRAFLQQHLPDYMIPSAFVALDALPLTASGKLDYRALPPPDAAPSGSAAVAYIAPRTPQEELLAELWAQVLGLARVGRDDDFFALGGHSLLATQLIARVRESFAVELPLRTLFDAPTLSGLAARIAMALRATPEPSLPPLVPVARDALLPLSFAQQRLWFLDQLVPGNPFYNIPAALRLLGPLNLVALAHGLNVIIQRHEALRTTFVEQAGHPVQVIAPAVVLALPLLDLRGLPSEVRLDVATRLATIEAQRPFDLATGPLIRAVLLRLDSNEHALLLTLHHIVADGWSVGVFIRELAALYQAGAAGRDVTLPALPIQYADFAVWQRAWLQGDVLAAQLAYWSRHLRDAPVLQLPTDHPRPAMPTFRGASHDFTLAAPLTADLRALSQQADVTLFMTLLSAFALVLARYSGQNDLIVGAPIANRTNGEVEGLIGFFVNMLALRIDLAGNPRFGELLGRVRQVALQAYAHQDLPFELLVEELQPERDGSHQPLFQVTLALQNAPLPPLQLSNVTLSPLDIESGITQFDLTLYLWEIDGGIGAMLVYAVDLFEPAMIARLAEHFQLVLAGVVADPEQRIGEVALLTASERRQLEYWNATQADYPLDDCVQRLVEAQVARSPDALALVYETNDERRTTKEELSGFVLRPASSVVQVTYAELNRRANQLAHYLQGLGVGPEVRIGICMERSIELVISALGVLKAGAAYLPIDPVYPAARLAFVLEDAQVHVLITDSIYDLRLTIDDLEESQTSIVNRKSKIVNLQADWPRIAQQPDDNPADRATVANLAYVIYTSGSTGWPKGVQVDQRGLLNLIHWHQRAFAITRADRATLIAGVAFDAAVWELWPYLAAGASLHIPDDDTRALAAPLRDWLIRHAITISFMPTPLAEGLLALDWPNRLALRALLTGGDRLQRYPPPELPFALVNNYGPTENTVVTTSGHVSALDAAVGTPSIGRPIANTRVYLLDARGQPVPIGVAGELFIGGDSLARGYLDRPDLTAERFVPNPFAATMDAVETQYFASLPDVQTQNIASLPHSSRLYKTGDLARWRPDGTLAFLGRVDQQIKLRGFRIELGEIEARLTQHSAVRECVVIARPQSNDEQRLIAYVVPQPADPDSDPQGAAWAAAQVDHWQTLYDETYRQTAPSPDATFNIIGWNSSYTDQPIPAAEMREWVEQTVVRIQALRPQRVLEIGCGSGLLLFRLAPECAEYVGTDFSAAALDYLRQQPALTDLPQVRLLERTADDFSDIAVGGFDLVILNSVVQYFPSVGYLARVLAGALDVLAPGGALFVGDVRSRPLLATFRAAVQLQHAAQTLPLAALRQQLAQALAQEEELVLDPAFFGALATTLPLASVQLQLKRGSALNELTQFRYDVLLRKAPAVAVPPPARWQDWDAAGLTLAVLRMRLVTEAPAQLGLAAVPNARLVRAEAALDWLDQSTAATVADLTATLPSPEAGVEPQALWALGAELGYTVAISVAQSGRRDACDVVFQRATTAPDASGWTAQPALALPPTARPWASYANTPLQGQFTRRLAPLLRRALADQLPDYMIPSAFVLLDELPLTANGKVDRSALPSPEQDRLARETTFVAPRSALETVIAGVWARVLGLGQVGIEDNFFDLGGHSLLATQVVAQLRESFGVPLPVRLVFEAPTVAGLAATLLAEPRQRRRLERTAELLLQLAQLSEDDVDSLIAERTIRHTTG